jgi:hypothetical protein
MKEPPVNVLELPLDVRAMMAMREAVRKALEEHAREGRPAYIGQDGKVVALSPDEIRAFLAQQQDESKPTAEE